MRIGVIFIGFCLVFLFSCSEEGINTTNSYTPTPSPIEIPLVFENLILAPIPVLDNPQTVEGIALGRKLFYDPILSGDNSISCASCHAPDKAFTDGLVTSPGADGLLGTRNSMPLFNMAWNYDDQFFWDGAAFGLEEQALEPVANPIEMHNTWLNAVASLQQDLEYPTLFLQAFGSETISSENVTKAIAQFERTLISANAKFDRYLLGLETLTASELNGLNVFMDEAAGDCFHCHGSPSNPLWTDNQFHNNGLDATFVDLGLGAITGDPADNGKFRSPSLRNLLNTAPYMHDGRFATIDDVINHYSEGLVSSPTIDPLMKNVAAGGNFLSAQEKEDLKAFLLTLTDETFLINPAYQAP